ncbi:hypothetical protein ABW21_db0208020 [Orbilia brochopaga]|nr:hypothetical protein ABW21_db0208020 [Drechslerella brochopaga]
MSEQGSASMAYVTKVTVEKPSTGSTDHAAESTDMTPVANIILVEDSSSDAGTVQSDDQADTGHQARWRGDIVIVPRETVKSRAKGARTVKLNTRTPREIFDELRNARLQVQRAAAAVLKEHCDVRLESLDDVKIRQSVVNESTYLWHIDEDLHCRSGRYSFKDLTENWAILDDTLHKAKPICEYTLTECQAIQKFINDRLIKPYIVIMNPIKASNPKKRKRTDIIDDQESKKAKGSSSNLSAREVQALKVEQSFISEFQKELKAQAKHTTKLSFWAAKVDCKRTGKVWGPWDTPECKCEVCMTKLEIRETARSLARLRDRVVVAANAVSTQLEDEEDLDDTAGD